jgi:hypothetical protein
VQDKPERSSFIAAVHLVGQLDLFGHPGDERLRRKALRRLRGTSVDLPHDDVLPPMHIDAEFDHAVWFYALRGGCTRRGLRIVSCHHRWSGWGLGARLTTPCQLPGSPG